jgi:hypothetical protein
MHLSKPPLHLPITRCPSNKVMNISTQSCIPFSPLLYAREKDLRRITEPGSERILCTLRNTSFISVILSVARYLTLEHILVLRTNYGLITDELRTKFNKIKQGLANTCRHPITSLGKLFVLRPV